LRVCDASIFPTVTSGNTNAATIMVARKMGDAIVEDARHDSLQPDLALI
jgi:choline dehydrogenase